MEGAFADQPMLKPAAGPAPLDQAWQGDGRHEDFYGSGGAGVDRTTGFRPDAREAELGRPAEEGREEAGSRREGLQGGARTNSGAQGEIRSLGRGAPGRAGQEAEVTAACGPQT